MMNSPLTHFSEKKFLVIAHRGASHYAPENTMSAFKMAWQMKADIIELDVQLSKDGVPVVFHDAKLDNHSNGRGLVSEFLFGELQQLDAGKWFSIEFMGERIPALRDVLKWASGKIMLNIEIKKEAVRDAAGHGVEEKVVKLIQEFGMQRYVIISSFDYRAIERTKKLAPDIFTGLLYRKKNSGNRGPVELLEDYRADFFHCSKSEMGKKWIRQLKDAGKRYLIYTVNRKKVMKNWLQREAFGIFSDKPDKLREAADLFPEEFA